jgi:hypothetical protein
MAPRARAHSTGMSRSLAFAACLFFVAAGIGCDGPGETQADAEPIDGVPLQAVTARAVSPHGLVVGGVSSEDELFWDAWLVPGGGASPRRLAPVDNLFAVDAGGALWTTIVSEDDAGHIEYETRLSPADGSPSVPLSRDLPAAFAAERAVSDGRGGRLLIGSELVEDGARHLLVFAVAADGAAHCVARDPVWGSALVVDAALAPGALNLDVVYDADRPSTIVRVPLPARSAD